MLTCKERTVREVFLNSAIYSKPQFFTVKKKVWKKAVQEDHRGSTEGVRIWIKLFDISVPSISSGRRSLSCGGVERRHTKDRHREKLSLVTHTHCNQAGYTHIHTHIHTINLIYIKMHWDLFHTHTNTLTKHARNISEHYLIVDPSLLYYVEHYWFHVNSPEQRFYYRIIGFLSLIDCSNLFS